MNRIRPPVVYPEAPVLVRRFHRIPLVEAGDLRCRERPLKIRSEDVHSDN